VALHEEEGGDEGGGVVRHTGLCQPGLVLLFVDSELVTVSMCAHQPCTKERAACMCVRAPGGGGM
jgi:hypothetical protein